MGCNIIGKPDDQVLATINSCSYTRSIFVYSTRQRPFISLKAMMYNIYGSCRAKPETVRYQIKARKTEVDIPSWYLAHVLVDILIHI